MFSIGQNYIENSTTEINFKVLVTERLNTLMSDISVYVDNPNVFSCTDPLHFV